jgi:hypothetical protein
MWIATPSSQWTSTTYSLPVSRRTNCNAKFEEDGNRYQYAWPPPQSNMALQYLATMPPDPFIISEAAKGTYIEARNRRVLEDNRRQIAEAEQRQREFESNRPPRLRPRKSVSNRHRERAWPSG